VRVELDVRDSAIAKLKTELELQGDVKQLNLFPPEPTPTPEPELKPEPTPEPKPTPEPNPVKLVIDSDSEIVNPDSTTEPKTKTKTKTKPEPEPETKLLNPRQLAEWINKNCNPEKPVKDHNLRDWFNKKSTCTDEYRAEMQEKYGFKFSHHNDKNTCLFAIPE
jgi:hypothetical protein